MIFLFAEISIFINIPVRTVDMKIVDRDQSVHINKKQSNLFINCSDVTSPYLLLEERMKRDE